MYSSNYNNNNFNFELKLIRVSYNYHACENLPWIFIFKNIKRHYLKISLNYLYRCEVTIFIFFYFVFSWYMNYFPLDFLSKVMELIVIRI